MAVVKRNQNSAAAASMRLRQAKMMKSFNKGKLQKFLKHYAPNATVHDPDLPAVSGMQSITDYFIELFDYAKERNYLKMYLRSKKTVVKGKFIYDLGDYYWSTVRCGRYIHKWAWINDDYYMISDRFTIEEKMPSSPLINDENADISYEMKQIRL